MMSIVRRNKEDDFVELLEEYCIAWGLNANLSTSDSGLPDQEGRPSAGIFNIQLYAVGPDQTVDAHASRVKFQKSADTDKAKWIKNWENPFSGAPSLGIDPTLLGKTMFGRKGNFRILGLWGGKRTTKYPVVIEDHRGKLRKCTIAWIKSAKLA